MQNTKQTGFTLIELMVTVAIVGILATVALPSYQDYVTRGRIPDGLGLLATKRVQLEQFFLDNRTYVGASACTSDSTSSKYFTFSCTTQTATAYTLQAAGQGAMAGFTYTVNQSNAKTTAAVPNGWSAPSPNNCWVIKKGGQC